MASYKVVWRTSAERELRKLPREVIANMVELAATPANDPFPPLPPNWRGPSIRGAFVPAITV